MKYLILILLLTSKIWGQTEETVKIYQEGDKAFDTQDYEKARSIYSSLTKIDSLKSKPWFNLGVVELTMGNQEDGCNCIKKAYRMNHPETEKVLREYCSEFFGFFEDVDFKPMFIHKSKEYPIFIEKQRLNPKFLKIFQNRMESSKYLMTTLKSKRIAIFVEMTKDGIKTRVMFVPSSERDKTLLAITDVFQSIAYVPAKYKGKEVDILEMWSFPLIIEPPKQPVRNFPPNIRKY